MPMTPFIGVRISWLMFARNSDLVFDAASAASINGPSDVKLKDQAVLHLPADYVFVPQKESAELMHMWGNNTGPGFVGLVFDKDPNAPWTIAITGKFLPDPPTTVLSLVPEKSFIFNALFRSRPG